MHKNPKLGWHSEIVPSSSHDIDNFKVHINSKTSILSSPKKFKGVEEKLTSQARCLSELGTLEELKDVAEHQQISISGKVVAFLSPVEQIVMKASEKHLSKQELRWVMALLLVDV